MADDSLAWLDSVIDAIPLNKYSAAGYLEHVSPILSSGLPQTSSQLPATASPSPSTPRSSCSSEGPAVSSSKPSSSRPPRRRIRPKIALDPHQPPTAQGKPRARVYVACDQCSLRTSTISRIRKTRCDGAKPVCFNCRKRPPEVGECSYEMQPKRRGQDKVPGTRTRTLKTPRAKKRQRRSEEQTAFDSNSDHSEDESHHSPQLRASYTNFPHLSSPEDSAEEYDPFPVVDLDPPSANSEYYVPHECPREEQLTIPPRPSIQFTRHTWWDALLTFYIVGEGTTNTNTDTIMLSSEQRSSTVRLIVADLRALFGSSIYWVSFIHIPRFLDMVLNPTRRQSMQPSLVLSALAVGIFTQSSEAEQGGKGRAKALKLLDLAYSALQASLSSGWVDIGLIQAAWLIVYFEMQSHPMQSVERNRSSLLLLDSLIRLFSLTTLDADLKRANTQHSTSFPNTAVPSNIHHLHLAGAPITSPYHSTFYSQPGLASSHIPAQTNLNAPSLKPIVPDNITLGPSTSTTGPYCNCATLTLGHNWPSIMGIAPAWASTVMWPETLPEGEFRKEECRRLVWAAVMLTASLNSYTSVLEDIEKNRLWIKDPDNYALLFPGESLAMAGVPVQANNVWTLYLRAMLLLHTCVRKRGDMSLSDAERAQFAMHAWLEIDAIEGAIDRHTCRLEHSFGFQAREMLFSSRMCVSHEFQRYIPLVSSCPCSNGSRLFYRDKAEAWLKHRMLTAEQVWQDTLAGVHAQVLDCRRPLLIYWFMSHVIKALMLWRADTTLIVALEASKTFAKRLEYLMTFWPSTVQRREWQNLRYQLVEACIKCGIPPPELPRFIPRTSSEDAP